MANTYFKLQIMASTIFFNSNPTCHADAVH